MVTPTGTVNYDNLFTGCIAYYDLRGDAKDMINQYDMTSTGTPTATTNRFGMINSAYSYDSTNKGFYNSDIVLPSLGDFTISAWFYPVDNTCLAIGAGTSTSNNYYLWISYELSNGGFVVMIRTTASNRLKTLTGSTGEWTHLIVTYDTSLHTTRVFINGVKSAVKLTTTLPASINRFSIGYLERSTDYFPGNGYTSDVGVWNRILSDDEAKALYDITKTKVIAPYMRRTKQQ